MNRRGFLGMLGAVVAASPKPSVVAIHVTDPLGTPAAIAAAVDQALKPRLSWTWGYLTPDIVTANGYDNTTVRVFLDGHEVTREGRTILACDDRVGYIEVLAKDWAGHYRRDEGDPTKLARERLYGHVRVTMRRRV